MGLCWWSDPSGEWENRVTVSGRQGTLSGLGETAGQKAAHTHNSQFHFFCQN